MGISTECFTFYGIKLDWNQAFADVCDDVYAELEDYVILDGMSGEYIVIGAKLFSSGDARYGEMSGFGEIDLDRLPEAKAGVVAKITEFLPVFAHLLDREWKLMTFVHYS